MSIFDRLLETDAEKLQEKEKTELKIKRLSDIVGEPFVVTCAALTEDQMVHVSEISKEGDFRANILLESCRIEGRRLSDKELLNKLGVASGKDAIKALFSAGEISIIYSTINRLSGYDDGAVTEVKNCRAGDARAIVGYTMWRRFGTRHLKYTKFRKKKLQSFLHTWNLNRKKDKSCLPNITKREIDSINIHML